MLQTWRSQIFQTLWGGEDKVDPLKIRCKKSLFPFRRREILFAQPNERRGTALKRSLSAKSSLSLRFILSLILHALLCLARRPIYFPCNHPGKRCGVTIPIRTDRVLWTNTNRVCELLSCDVTEWVECVFIGHRRLYGYLDKVRTHEVYSVWAFEIGVVYELYISKILSSSFRNSA